MKLLLGKNKLLRKPIHILSSHKISRPITKNDYINIDIPCLINSREWILACKKKQHLEFIKSELNHPYFISSTEIQDLSYYLNKRNSNIVLILNIYCDLVTKSVVYIIAFIFLEELENGKIPVQVCKIKF